MGVLLLSVLGGFTVWWLISLWRAQWEEGGRAQEEWKGRLVFCWSYAMMPLPQIRATRPFPSSCAAETDLSACESGQTACPEEWNFSNGHETPRAQLRWGNWRLPSHSLFPLHRTRDHFWRTKISIMPPCLSILWHVCCYYLLNSKLLTLHSGTLGGGKIQTTVLSGVPISTSIKSSWPTVRPWPIVRSRRQRVCEQMKGVGVAQEDKVTLKENLGKSRTQNLWLAFTSTCRLAMLTA